jgi:hypothetical protein
VQQKTRRTLFFLRLGIQFAIALVLSLVITIVNHGVGSGFPVNWAKGFVVAFAIIPPALQIIPPVARGVRAVLGDRSPLVIGCVVSVCVATMMEGLIALAITLAQFGFASGWAALWGMAFLKALPIGLVIGFTMTFLVQPRMQKMALGR